METDFHSLYLSGKDKRPVLVQVLDDLITRAMRARAHGWHVSTVPLPDREAPVLVVMAFDTGTIITGPIVFPVTAVDSLMELLVAARDGVTLRVAEPPREQ